MRTNTSVLHWRIGWSALTVFVLGGLVLEALHGLKIAGYLDPENATRRELWTLAHAHGTLIAVVNLVFAAFVGQRGEWSGSEIASRSFVAALVLVSLGFFLGGAMPGPTDPGVGIWLVPPGGFALLVACVLVARRALRRDDKEATS